MREIMVRTERCLGCKSCELACAVAHSDSKTLYGAVFETWRPQKRVFVETNGVENIPLQCRQCTDTPCVQACMAGAMHVDAVTGLVQVDEARCVGCWMCVMACSFGVIAQVPATHKAAKCDRCRERNYDPACVAACPTKAIEFVEINEFTRQARKHYLNQMLREA